MIDRGGLKTFNHKKHKLFCKLVKQDKETIHFSIAQSRQNPAPDICFSLANTVYYLLVFDGFTLKSLLCITLVALCTWVRVYLTC